MKKQSLIYLPLIAILLGGCAEKDKDDEKLYLPEKMTIYYEGSAEEEYVYSYDDDLLGFTETYTEYEEEKTIRTVRYNNDFSSCEELVQYYEFDYSDEEYELVYRRKYITTYLENGSYRVEEYHYYDDIQDFELWTISGETYNKNGQILSTGVYNRTVYEYNEDGFILSSKTYGYVYAQGEDIEYISHKTDYEYNSTFTSCVSKSYIRDYKNYNGEFQIDGSSSIVYETVNNERHKTEIVYDKNLQQINTIEARYTLDWKVLYLNNENYAETYSITLDSNNRVAQYYCLEKEHASTYNFTYNENGKLVNSLENYEYDDTTFVYNANFKYSKSNQLISAINYCVTTNEDEANYHKKVVIKYSDKTCTEKLISVLDYEKIAIEECASDILFENLTRID